MMKVDSGTFTQTISDYEEHVWLLQQQNPERVMKHISSWQLCDPINITKLLTALQHVIEEVPDLNARYNLSNNGDLIKHTAKEWYSCIEFSTVDSYPAMVEKIIGQQAVAWIPEDNAPFKALIISNGDQVILSLILHEILAPMVNEREIVRSLWRAYSGERTVSFPLKRPDLPLFHEQHISPIPGLCRLPVERAIIHSGSRNSEWNNRELAMRWKTTLSVDYLQMQSIHEDSHNIVLTGVILRFARFIALISGKNSQALCLLLEDGPRYLVIDTAEDDARVAVSIADTLRSQMAPIPPKTENPWVYIRVLSNSVESDEKQTWPGQPVLLPTSEQCPDIELAVEESQGKTVTLILTLGQAVYSSLGEYLLDRLTSFLQSDDSVTVNLTPGQPVASHYVLPEEATDMGVNEAAAIILSEFRMALNVPDMSLTDDFFDYGGHSLLATRVIGRLLNTHGLEVHFGDFFSYPSAATLAQHAVPTHKTEKAVVVTPHHNSGVTAPLGLAQESLWKAYKANDFGTMFNLPFALDLLDSIDEILLEKALTDIVERHASLRTLFYEKKGKAACQQVIDMSQLADYKWFWGSSESQGVSLKTEAAYRFDLALELPIRIRVLHNPTSGRQTLSFLVHHMAIDEWSLNVIMEELSHAYASRAANKAPDWKNPALAFHDFTVRQRAGEVNQQHLAFWCQMLRDATHGLPLSGLNSHAMLSTGASTAAAKWLEYRPQPEISQRLYSLARENNTSLFTVIYAAIALTLHKLGNLNEIVIGTSASGRTDQETHETVGYFTTMVAHRVKFECEKPVKDLLTSIRDTINNSMQYADIPLDIVQQSLGMGPEEGLIFDVYIQIHSNNALNGTLRTPSGNNIRYRQIDPDKTESMFGLQFEIMEDIIEGERNIRLVITYRTERYPEQFVKRISAAIDSIFNFLTTPESLHTDLARISL